MTAEKSAHDYYTCLARQYIQTSLSGKASYELSKRNHAGPNRREDADVTHLYILICNFRISPLPRAKVLTSSFFLRRFSFSNFEENFSTFRLVSGQFHFRFMKTFLFFCSTCRRFCTINSLNWRWINGIV